MLIGIFFMKIPFLKLLRRKDSGTQNTSAKAVAHAVLSGNKYILPDKDLTVNKNKGNFLGKKNLFPYIFARGTCASLSLSLSLSNKYSELTNEIALINSKQDEYIFSVEEEIIVCTLIYYSNYIILC
jgi:hypothetical protein